MVGETGSSDVLDEAGQLVSLPLVHVGLLNDADVGAVEGITKWTKNSIASTAPFAIPALVRGVIANA
jgi:hypothetical protein